MRPRRARQHQAGEFVTAAQLKKHFYRPDVIKRAFNLADAGAAVREAGLSGFKLADLTNHMPPKFRIADPGDVSHANRSPVSVKLELAATDDPVTGFDVTVNGRQAIISQMERAAGLAHDDALQARFDKLDALLALTATSTQDAALFAEMLSLPNDGRYPAHDLAPQQRRQKTLEALTSQLAELARRQPVLMIFEDAHWTDPTSLEAFGRTVDRIKSVRALLIVTFRPEFNAPWAGRSHVMSMALNRLGERETAAIIARLVGNKELPADVMAEIVERTDGIPLFVEEMTIAGGGGRGRSATHSCGGSVPGPGSARKLTRIADGAA